MQNQKWNMKIEWFGFCGVSMKGKMRSPLISYVQFMHRFSIATNVTHPLCKVILTDGGPHLVPIQHEHVHSPIESRRKPLDYTVYQQVQ